MRVYLLQKINRDYIVYKIQVSFWWWLCYCCLPCNHCSYWAWVEILVYGARMCLTLLLQNIFLLTQNTLKILKYNYDKHHMSWYSSCFLQLPHHTQQNNIGHKIIHTQNLCPYNWFLAFISDKKKDLSRWSL